MLAAHGLAKALSSATQESLAKGSESNTDPDEKPRLSFSLQPGQVMEGLAADRSRFRRGEPSSSKDMAEIARAYQAAPGEVKVSEWEGMEGHSNYLHVYDVDNANGGQARIYHDRGRQVWVDTSRQRADEPAPGMAADTDSATDQKTQGGDLVYQMAMTYAHNNGLEFIPDPNGVSAIAKNRRISQMLSSALRHGTTDHLFPSGTGPKTEGTYEELPGWNYRKTRQAYQHNVDLLARAEYEWVKKEMAARGENIESLKWDATTDTITHDSEVQPLTEKAIGDLLSRLDSSRSGIGKTTLSRALVTQATLRGDVRGSYRTHGRNAPVPVLKAVLPAQPRPCGSASKTSCYASSVASTPSSVRHATHRVMPSAA